MYGVFGVMSNILAFVLVFVEWRKKTLTWSNLFGSLQNYVAASDDIRTTFDSCDYELASDCTVQELASNFSNVTF